MKTFESSWHCRFLILPFIVIPMPMVSVAFLHNFIPLFWEAKLDTAYACSNGLCLTLGTGLLWYMLAVIPYKIAIRQDGRIGFQTIFTQTILSASQISKIEHHIFTSSLHHCNGKIRLTRFMNDFGSIVSSIEGLNPDVVVKHPT
jgi:hypothetical protein